MQRSSRRVGQGPRLTISTNKIKSQNNTSPFCIHLLVIKECNLAKINKLIEFIYSDKSLVGFYIPLCINNGINNKNNLNEDLNNNNTLLINKLNELPIILLNVYVHEYYISFSVLALISFRVVRPRYLNVAFTLYYCAFSVSSAPGSSLRGIRTYISPRILHRPRAHIIRLVYSSRIFSSFFSLSTCLFFVYAFSPGRASYFVHAGYDPGLLVSINL